MNRKHPRVHYAGRGHGEPLRVVAIVMALTSRTTIVRADGWSVPRHRGNDCRTVLMAGVSR